MKIVKYKDYEEYVEVQTVANKKAPDYVWVTPKEISVVTKWIKRHIPDASFGICHGVKHGWEVQAFRNRLNIEVIGTEISDSASQYPNVIQWDFHHVKEEWIGSADFVYSNAWDHSYDPQMCLDQWMKCVKPTGRCFVEWTPYHDTRGCSDCDCFGASMEEYRQIMETKYTVDDLLVVSRKTRLAPGKLLRLKVPIRTTLKRVIFVVKHRVSAARAA